MQQHSNSFLFLLLMAFIAGIVLSLPPTPQRSRVRRQNMKVRISTKGDTIVMKFLHPNTDTKLEGYILGYGSSMFSKQFIQLPENGQPYETEFDAEPKYLVAVQPILTNEVKKQCTGKVQLEKPLNVVIGSVTPTSVILSWGTLLKIPYEGNVMNDCLEDGHYTVRYREKNRKWNYQTCPTSDTVIDNLKPNTVYEFGVQSNSKDGTGMWSKPVVHNISTPVLQKKFTRKIFKRPISPVKLFPPGPKSFPFPPQPAVLQNKTQGKQPISRNLIPQTTLASPITTAKQEFPPTAGPKLPVVSKQPVVLRPPAPENKKPNLVGESKDDDKLKLEDKDSILKPIPVVTAKPKQERKHQTTTAIPAVNSSRFDMHENSSIFRPLPASEVDIMGKKRFVAPHVIYKTDKKPDEPCSITSSMAYFPDEEGSDQNVTGPPRTAPSNLTVVTVEGCPSFVILDWEKSDNDTREYEVVSITTGPHGKEVSILMTNQTHTTVENLTPESNYEFKVTPKNELGTGPSSEPVTFSTESADPRVSEHASGKNAIWTQFPFKADAYSECNGKQYIKRTWYRKFVGIQLCNSLRYKIYLSDSLNGKFYNIGDQTGYGEDHCQFVDSFLDGLTGTRMMSDQLQSRQGFFRALRHEPVHFGDIGGKSHVTYVGWYECGTPIPGKW
ncbi:target of Nesh-SH3 isoform X8 [Austrofundulus limnaeus]|uniref:Target of Nesh-SH3 isoform X8 n=1 Tax=Austrofundulus limnaeus TaxID=52670 RepID=A0A2I4D2C5_AUSLI|nr:PREDICTED: target of Nesh-SH3-like isoform X8 [Austrofundulus limnaeus]